MSKLILFDCDETLWTSPDKDYISSRASVLQPISKTVIQRQADNKQFTLTPGVAKAFRQLKSSGHQIGIVSDNLPEPVAQALQLFGLTSFITPEAVNVRLWKGHCPKHEMVAEILSHPSFAATKPSNVFWLDDKNYAEEAQLIGVNFILVAPKFSIGKFAEKL